MTKPAIDKPFPRDAAERFWSKVAIGDGEACWPWKAGKRPKGYGCVTANGRGYGAHRVAYELANGPIAAGLFVLHRCDNPPCCNPAHLFLGTSADNIADMVAKGRANYSKPPVVGPQPQKGRVGERNGSAKLSTAEVVAIRTRRAAGEGPTAIAADYGVRPETVRLIALGKSRANG